MPRLSSLRNASFRLAASTLLFPGAALAAADDAARPLQPLLLDVSVNGQASEQGQLFLQDEQGRTYASEALIDRLRLKRPAAATVTFEGETFYPLGGPNSLKGEVSAADQSIALQAPADLFQRQQSQFGLTDEEPMTPSGTGGFLNYDMFAERSGGSLTLSGAFDAGFFSRYGVGATGFVGRIGSGDSSLVRLDSNWTIDRPGSMASIRIGDGISRGGFAAPPVRFAGIQYARNFNVRPGFVTMPLPTASGSAAVPSVIDIYVNNVHQGSREIEAGPFDIMGVPLQSGGGSLQMVVRDMLGREVVSTQSYYASTQMLRKGLHDFSYELGFLRKDFGIRSNSYGALMGSATHRYGITDRVTGEALLQASASTQVAGAGVSTIVGNLGAVTASANFSNSDRGQGHSVSLGIERTSFDLSVGVRAEMASKSYAYVGMGPGEAPAKLSGQAFVDFPLFGGTVGLSYIHRDNRGRPDEALAGISSSVNLGRFGSLQLYARHAMAGKSQTSVGAFLTLPIGGGRVASASVELDGGNHASSLSWQKDAPVGNGFGYSTRISRGSSTTIDGRYRMNSDVASWGAEVARGGGRAGMRR